MFGLICFLPKQEAELVEKTAGKQNKALIVPQRMAQSFAGGRTWARFAQ
jgi:hypothetical protein